MKSTIEQLEKRGFVAVGFEKKYLDTTFIQRIMLLKSKCPTERTLGARLLTKNADLSTIDHLIEALINEKMLYPKIEICNSLVTFGMEAITPLIGLLGSIGNNQHKEVPITVFKKNNYPLPRDIAGRALIRIGTKTIPDLLKIMEGDDLMKLSEAIDAIGFICFYNHQAGVFGFLKKCFEANAENNLILWKIFRAMSAFPESESFLKKELQQTNEPLKLEIERSLLLIRKRA